jgi:hypothetical protein
MVSTQVGPDMERLMATALKQSRGDYSMRHVMSLPIYRRASTAVLGYH